jgi:hypothetical protein
MATSKWRKRDKFWLHFQQLTGRGGRGLSRSRPPSPAGLQMQLALSRRARDDNVAEKLNLSRKHQSVQVWRPLENWHGQNNTSADNLQT